MSAPGADERPCFGAAASRLCAAACQLLGWRPGDFWEATPMELRAMLADGAAGPPAMDGAELQALRLRFPD